MVLGQLHFRKLVGLHARSSRKTNNPKCAVHQVAGQWSSMLARVLVTMLGHSCTQELLSCVLTRRRFRIAGAVRRPAALCQGAPGGGGRPQKVHKKGATALHAAADATYLSQAMPYPTCLPMQTRSAPTPAVYSASGDDRNKAPVMT
jgi:hypothetical protein